MNSIERKQKTVLMGNYRRFASKYDGGKPRLDPLVSKKVQSDIKVRSPVVSRNLIKNKLSTEQNDLNSSLDSVRRVYEDERKDSPQDGIISRKSQSISGILPVLSSKEKKPKTTKGKPNIQYELIATKESAKKLTKRQRSVFGAKHIMVKDNSGANLRMMSKEINNSNDLNIVIDDSESNIELNNHDGRGSNTDAGSVVRER